MSLSTLSAPAKRRRVAGKTPPWFLALLEDVGSEDGGANQQIYLITVSRVLPEVSPAREKPMRGEADEAERKRVCNKVRKLPVSYWLRRVLLYMDNTRWDAPTTAKGKKFVKMIKVRGHLRKRSEGLKKGFTKPSVRAPAYLS